MAPPEKERAKEAVVELLAAARGVGTDDIKVVSGYSSHSKVIAINGMNGATEK